MRTVVVDLLVRPRTMAAQENRCRTDSRDERTPGRKPTNPLVTPLLTDFYQISMAYTYWKQGRHEKPAVFERVDRRPLTTRERGRETRSPETP